MNTGYTYDALSRLLAVPHQANSATIDGAGYVYDAAGNRTSRTALPSNLPSQFTYDPIYQLTQVMRDTKAESYAYDAVGNRTYQPGSPYTYNGSNEMLTREGCTVHLRQQRQPLARPTAAARRITVGISRTG